MQKASRIAANVWQAGPFRGRARGLLFGVMHEDAAIEISAFAPRSRVFCIASAGCTAGALAAAGHDVTAVDINGEQILYAQARAAGAPAQPGAAERLLSQARLLFPLLGWTEDRCRRFLSMCDPAEQIRYWQQTLDTKRWRMAADAALSSSLLRFAYRNPFVACLPRRFGSVIRARLERTFRNHPNNANPYAWRLFSGETPWQTEPPGPGIRFVCADAATYLEGCEPASFDAFSLSNIADGAEPLYIQRLWRAVARAAASGAIVVTRSFAEPVMGMTQNLAARDRSMIWGTVRACPAGDLCCTF